MQIPINTNSMIAGININALILNGVLPFIVR
jgi:hypothetical protein